MGLLLASSFWVLAGGHPSGDVIFLATDYVE
jgi:hypothetical protein